MFLRETELANMHVVRKFCFVFFDLKCKPLRHVFPVGMHVHSRNSSALEGVGVVQLLSFSQY